MSVKFSQVIRYFETIARLYKPIGHTDSEKHFFRMELDEVLEGINRTDVTTPFLILEGYTYDFTDNKSDNVLKNRRGAFLVLDKVSDKSDHSEIQNAWENMEIIGDDILNKMKADKKNRNVPAVRDFDFSSVEAALVACELDNHYGIRYTYSISSIHDTEQDPTKWTPETPNGSI